jgi:hypothetical protein
MSKWWKGIAGLCCLGLPAGAGEAGRTEWRWLGDYEEARREARASGKPIFVVFRCEH